VIAREEGGSNTARKWTIIHFDYGELFPRIPVARDWHSSLPSDETLSPPSCSIYFTIEMLLKYRRLMYYNVLKPKSVLMSSLFSTTIIPVIS
jgi:hypothetical protein